MAQQNKKSRHHVAQGRQLFSLLHCHVHCHSPAVILLYILTTTIDVPLTSSLGATVPSISPCPPHSRAQQVLNPSVLEAVIPRILLYRPHILTSVNMSGPSLRISLPSWSLFKFPPDSAPPALPPLSDHHSFASPFAIPADLYNDLLSPAWPITIATVYAITVFSVNASNRKAGNKPWAISKTRLFRAFVIAHNVFLAVYSAVTCAAMVQALRHTWSGASSQNGLVGAVDALCKMHGPRGLGGAAAYNSSTNLWEIKNGLIRLGANGSPDPTDVGRLWNEGLAFWGWFFYLSKFYEVLDTFIILAKGKRSSTLQTYHHAGAMLCMWAGIRFMSPPIWMFVSVNSGIHALMVS